MTFNADCENERKMSRLKTEIKKGKGESMVNLPLYLKHRPVMFEDIVGNQAVLKSLKLVLERKTGEQRSFLLSGQTGCGKTTVARIIKNYFDCSDHDFYEYNVGNTRGIDTVREIDEMCRVYSITGGHKIFMLDECHAQTTQSQQAILKLLEDTPSHVRFILCTTEPDKLIKPIRNRCMEFKLKPLKEEEMGLLINAVIEKERKKVATEVINKIIAVSDGCPRQALVLLDSVIDMEERNEMLKMISSNSVDESVVIDLCRALISKKDWKTVAGILSTLDKEPEKVRYAVLGYMSVVLLKQNNSRVARIIELFSENWFYSGKAGMILACYLACFD